jgi:hypothetical protein
MRFKTLFSGLVTLMVAALPLQGVQASETEVHVSYVRPDVDYSNYEKFLIQPLDISDTKLIPPPWVEGKAGQPRPWKISKKNAEFLQGQYSSAMKKQLQDKGGYELATEAGSDTLEVEIEIISLTPYAQPEDKVITKGSGEMTIRAEVRDSRSGELLVLYEGDEQVGEDYHEHTEFSVDQDVEALFEGWGDHLRQALDEAKAE